MKQHRSLVVLLVVLGLVGCTRNVGTATDPTASAGIPPVLTVATVDFPSRWLAERVGGDAVEVVPIAASEVAATDADLFAYVSGLDAQVDAAAAGLPQDRVIDVTDDVNRVASPRDPQVPDPFVWFDPVNVGTMAQTVASGLISVSPTPFEASQFYGLRGLSVQNEALGVDQSLQEMFNPCRIPTLVVEAPVLNYLARAYAFDQVPLILWKPGGQRVESLYYTVDAQPAVEAAANRNGIGTVPVDTFTESAPEDDLLQGLLDLGDQIAANQDCPLVTPSSSDRPG
jgi:ABC-type Zn uptake system ZnuABC Zn-binding protein ZnuA